jgi:hypothetical protein
VFAIARGYDDLNDHDDLRHNPVMIGRPRMPAAGSRLTVPVWGLD